VRYTTLLPSFLSWYSLHCIEQCMYVMRADSRANVTASCGPFFPPLDAVFKLTTEISECLSCAVAMMFMLMMHSSLALLNVLTHLESMATHSPINRRAIFAVHWNINQILLYLHAVLTTNFDAEHASIRKSILRLFHHCPLRLLAKYASSNLFLLKRRSMEVIDHA
jgi:hypothetical protein